MFRHPFCTVVAGAVLLAACSDPEPAVDDVTAPPADENPFFSASDLPYGMPPFDRIDNEHFAPAFERGMAEQVAEIEAIAGNSEAPTFDNTILALERSGQLLSSARRVFSNLTSAHTNEALQAVQQEMAPRFAAHFDGILLNTELFGRVSALYDARDSLGLRKTRQDLEQRAPPGTPTSGRQPGDCPIVHRGELQTDPPASGEPTRDFSGGP